MKITFHSWLKTAIGSDHEDIVLPEGVITISDLSSFLGKRHLSAASIFALPEALRYVVDHRYVTPEHVISSADAIEIYPPVTGG
ncbi:MoaD/ThiS family protein [Chelatococcus asaccharovorans]|uniref:MoaD/ThiS family protein n=1 Tax=Chelatococcus asaccharovorans TaxID=28210 RepID=UPI002264C8A6|nr:MoaD/ThiS family protein [Chelatococcus asaccharovorans]